MRPWPDKRCPTLLYGSKNGFENNMRHHSLQGLHDLDSGKKFSAISSILFYCSRIDHEGNPSNPQS
jgi:hypothetical protein